MASIKQYQVDVGTERVISVAHEVNARLFGGQASLGPVVRSDSPLRYAPVTDLSVRLDGERGMAMVGLVLKFGLGTEHAPMTLMKLINGQPPHFSQA